MVAKSDFIHPCCGVRAYFNLTFHSLQQQTCAAQSTESFNLNLVFTRQGYSYLMRHTAGDPVRLRRSLPKKQQKKKAKDADATQVPTWMQEGMAKKIADPPFESQALACFSVLGLLLFFYENFYQSLRLQEEKRAKRNGGIVQNLKGLAFYFKDEKFGGSNLSICHTWSK